MGNRQKIRKQKRVFDDGFGMSNKRTRNRKRDQAIKKARKQKWERFEDKEDESS